MSASASSSGPPCYPYTLSVPTIRSGNGETGQLVLRVSELFFDRVHPQVNAQHLESVRKRACVWLQREVIPHEVGREVGWSQESLEQLQKGLFERVTSAVENLTKPDDHREATSRVAFLTDGSEVMCVKPDSIASLRIDGTDIKSDVTFVHRQSGSDTPYLAALVALQKMIPQTPEIHELNESTITFAVNASELLEATIQHIQKELSAYEHLMQQIKQGEDVLMEHEVLEKLRPIAAQGLSGADLVEAIIDAFNPLQVTPTDLERQAKFEHDLQQYLHNSPPGEQFERDMIVSELMAAGVNCTSFSVTDRHVTALPELSQLIHLQEIYITGCSALISLPGLDQLTNLVTLSLSTCDALVILPDLSQLLNLVTLDLSGCKALISLPDLSRITNLETLVLCYCTALSILPDLSRLTRLKKLILDACESLRILPDLSQLTELEFLLLDYCKALISLPDLSRLTKLHGLSLDYCKDLISLPALSQLTKLEYLSLGYCTAITILPDLSQLMHLQELNLSGCRALVSLPELRTLLELERVNLNGCASLTRVPDLRECTRLSWLDLRNCPALQAPVLTPPDCLVERPHAQQFSFVSELDPSDEIDITLSEAQLEQQPRQFLFDLGSQLEQNQGTSPEDWRFHLLGPDQDDIAIDQQGVRRDVTYRLAQNLFRGEPEGLTHDGIPPSILPKSEGPVDHSAYIHLGHVLSIPLSLSAPIGALFDQRVYEGLSEALRDPCLRQDEAEARAVLGAIVCNDPLAFALEEQSIAQLSKEEWEVLTDRLEEVQADIVNEAMGWILLNSHSERTAAEQEARAYLLARYPRIGAWLEKGLPSITSEQLQQLSSFLDDHDPDLIARLEGDLRKAEATFEQVAIDLRDKIAAIDAKETATPADIVRKKGFEKRLRKALEAPLDEELRYRIEAALRRGAQMRADFDEVIKALGSLEEQVVQGLKTWRETNDVLQKTGDAIQAIAKGIISMLPASEDLSSFTAERLQVDLEGITDANTIKSLCPLHNDYHYDAEAIKTHQWLMNWLDHASESDLRSFCAFGTGAGALVLDPRDNNPPLRLIFTNAGENQLPIAHTCIRQLDIPKNYPDQDTFNYRLNTALKYGSGFGSV